MQALIFNCPGKFQRDFVNRNMLLPTPALPFRINRVNFALHYIASFCVGAVRFSLDKNNFYLLEDVAE